MYRDKSLLFAGSRRFRGIQPWDGPIFATAGLQQFAEPASEQEQQVPLAGGFARNSCQIGDFSVNFSSLWIASQDHDAVEDWYRPWTATAGGIGKLIEGTVHGTSFSGVSEESC